MIIVLVLKICPQIIKACLLLNLAYVHAHVNMEQSIGTKYGK
jgi:hypothetical protein